MIVSMTGFGDASAERGGTHYSVEIRSLNNRFYKSVIKLPDNLSGLEPEVDSTLREKLQRGSITFVLKLREDTADAAFKLNMPVLRAYVEQLRQLQGPNTTIDLAGLLALPGATQEAHDQSEEVERHGTVVRQCIEKAVAKVLEMRAREGRALCEDLVRHARAIIGHLEAVSARAPLVIEDYHKRLTARVNQLVAKAEISLVQADLLKEIALFAERSDICEEIQRLTEHMRAFEHECLQGEHAGRKLDFLTQEMLREANTIASKANDATIARHIVEIKGAIDRLKEQVQNVE
jgi:uncharacterized protein (TIGR00255 family)